MYTQLSADYKYSVIAAAVYAREIEHFHYDFDRVNFEYLIEILPDGKYKIDGTHRGDGIGGRWRILYCN